MDAKQKGFLDDTSLSKTPRSPLKTSTIAKENNKRRGDVLRKRMQMLETTDSLCYPHEETPISALNEVTNVQIRRKPDFDISDASLMSEVNSSLGILSIENASDFTDSSFSIDDTHAQKQASDNANHIKQDLRKSLKREENKVQSTLGTNVIPLRNSAINYDREITCSISSEDDSIEYDGTNIPELNYDSEPNTVYRTQNTSSVNKTELSENFARNSRSLTIENNDDDKSSLTSEVNATNRSRQSIFETPSYDSIFEHLMAEKPLETHKQSVSPQTLKVCPFLGFSSFEVDRILQRSSLAKHSSYDLENMRCSESSSVDFCPDQISARSSSFASTKAAASPCHSEISDLSCNEKPTVFSPPNQKDFLHSQEHYRSEKLRDSSLELKSFNSEAVNKNSDIIDAEHAVKLSGLINPFDNSEANISNDLAFYRDLKQELPDFTLGESVCNQLGISDSEFLSPDAAKEMLQRDMEIFKQEHKFEVGNLSKASGVTSWSPPTQNNITDPSWSDDVYSGRQISIGTFISAYTEPLGALSENPNRERPYFGTDASTPVRNVSDNSSTSSEKFIASTQDHDVLNDVLTTLKDPVFELESPVQKTSTSFAISQILSDLSTTDPIEMVNDLLERYFSKNQVIGNDKVIKNIISSNDCNVSQVIPPKQEVSKLENGQSLRKECDNSSMKYLSSENVNKFQIAKEIEGEYKTSSTPVETTRCLSLDNVFNLSSDDLSSNAKLPKSQHGNSNHIPPMSSVGHQSSCSSTCSSNPIVVNPHHGCMKYYGVNEHCHPNAVPSIACLPQPVNFMPGCQHRCNVPEANAVQAHSVQTLLQTLAASFPFFQSGNTSSYLVRGPSELYFPEKICIGDSHSMTLTLQNPPIACMYQLSCFSTKVNDIYLQSSPDAEKAGVIFNKMIPSSSSNTTDIQLVLAPKCEGKIEVDLLIVASFNDQGISSSTLPFRTKVHYEALRPTICFSSKGKESLDFGFVSVGSTVVEYVTLTNKTEVTVPLKISLSKDINDNLLYFGLKEMDRRKYPVSAGLKFPSPKTMEYRLPAAKSGLAFSQLEIPVVFLAGNNQNEINGYVVAAIETPTFNDTLAFFKISASVGVSKLILKDPRQNPFILRAKEGTTVRQNLVVFHEGSISAIYDLHIEDNEAFQVNPSSLHLKPYEKATISVTFSPISRSETKCTLQAAAQPYGKVFCITDIIGCVLNNYFAPNRVSAALTSHSNKLPTEPRSVPKITSNLIECNKKYLIWGGVDIGCSVTKSFAIRNASSEALQAKLFVKENSRSFQLLDGFDHKTTCMTIGMDPGEEKSINVSFSPVQVDQFSGLLAVKPIVRNEKKVFSIPLSGYGGISKLKILGLLDQEGVGYYLDVEVPLQMESMQKRFSIQNIGLRAAFVKMFLTQDGFIPHSSQNMITIHPSEFVLSENEQKDILVSFHCIKKCFNADCGVISIKYGDEIMRQRLRRAINDAKFRGTSDASMKSLDFDLIYEGEEQEPCDLNYVCSSKDVTLFHSSLKKMMIHLFMNGQNISLSRMSFDGLSIMQESCSDITFNSTVHSRTNNIDNHSPPVKDESVRKVDKKSLARISSIKDVLSSKSQVNIKENTNTLWSLMPEAISLSANKENCQVVVSNHSNYDMQFYVECTLDFISVSPIEKILGPRSKITLEVNVADQGVDIFMEDKQGFINIISNGQKKRIAVQILKNSGKQSLALTESQALADVSLKSDFLGESSFVESSNPMLVENIFNFPKHINLPRTYPGILSETSLTVKNPTREIIKWDIKPTSMIFCQFLEDSVGDNSRIIHIPTSSGSLKPMQTTPIVIRFLPPDVGNFSQFYEISCFCENNPVTKCNIKIEGEAVSSATTTNDKRELMCKSENHIAGKRHNQGVVIDTEKCEFPPTGSGETSTLYITIKNFSASDLKLNVSKPSLPFKINHSSISVKSKKFVKIPLYFKPKTSGYLYEENLLMTSASGYEFKVELKGSSL